MRLSSSWYAFRLRQSALKCPALELANCFVDNDNGIGNCMDNCIGNDNGNGNGNGSCNDNGMDNWYGAIVDTNEADDKREQWFVVVVVADRDDMNCCDDDLHE